MNMITRLLTAAVVLSSVAAGATEPLPTYFSAPRFALTDQDARPVTDADLKGKTWIVNFVFTRCGGVCPLMTQKLVKVSKGVTAPNVRFVSISVDPAYDRPPVLKEYAQERGATGPRFIFLTGDGDAIYNLAQKGFKLAAAPSKDGRPIEHDERFLLIDDAGNVRGIYHSNDQAKMAQLVADATSLAGGGSPGSGDGGGNAALIKRFPVINASLNATAGILLCVAMMFIQARRVWAHAVTMIAAVVCSVAFLACYLFYHYLKHQAGSALTVFPPSPWRPVYLAVLISHTILAVVIVPMIVMTLVRAWRRQWDRHRKIASPTFWLWLYVSATGVLVYWMLYHLAPRIVAQV